MKCIACGSTALATGSIVENSGGGTSMFRPNGVSIWKSIFGVGTREVTALGCLECHHLQLAVNFTNEDLERYQLLGCRVSEASRVKSG